MSKARNIKVVVRREYAYMLTHEWPEDWSFSVLVTESGNAYLSVCGSDPREVWCGFGSTIKEAEDEAWGTRQDHLPKAKQDEVEENHE